MHSFEFVLIALIYLTVFPITTSLSLSLKPVRLDSPTGPRSGFLSNHIPNFGIFNVWTMSGGAPPHWPCVIDVLNTTILFDDFIGIYSSRPPEDIANYNSKGPESSTAFTEFDTRLIVKQWVPPSGSVIPAGPMRNKEIATAAEMAKQLYSRPRGPETEGGWVMCFVAETRKYFTYCTGVLIVQRDLWYAGMAV